MMMTFESEELPIWKDSSSSINNKFCISCSILLSQTSEDYGDNQSFNLDSIFMDAAELSSSSSATTTTTTSQWLKKALFSVFKLNYLNAFDTFKEDQVEEDLFALCQNCNKILFNLHQLYNDFLELGRIDSYLHKKLQRLDEIIDSHQQKTIKCDLIIPPFLQIEVDNEQHISAVRNKSKKKIGPPTKTTTTNTSPLLNDGREPRIILTRLPESYTRRLQDAKVEDYDNTRDNYADYNSPPISNCADNDNPNDYLGIIPKVEVMDDVIVNEDDDYFQPPPPSPGSDSSAEYLPKSAQKRKTKKNIQRKEQSLRPRRSARRSANSIDKTSSIKSQPQRVSSKNKSKNNKEASTSSSSSNPTKKVKFSTSKSRRKKMREYYLLGTTRYLAKKAKYANPCWYCKKFFPTPADCLEHTKLEHLPENCDLSTSGIIICDRCSKICKNDRDLGVHLKKCELIPHGEVLPKIYSCSKCTKTFATKDSLSSHMYWHSRDKFFACDACSYVTPNHCTLARHKLSTHVPPDAPKFKCDQCDSVMKTATLFQKHIFRMHTPEGHQQYLLHKAKTLAKEKEDRRLKAMSSTTICGDCNLDCYSRGAFINHRRTFHGNNVGSFMCEICGLEVTKAQTLRAHMKYVHTDDRPFLCTQCGRSFKRVCGLREHEKRSHTEEGRLKHNQQIREATQRRKIRQNFLAHIQQQQQQRTEIPNTTMMDSSYPQPSQDWTNT